MDGEGEEKRNRAMMSPYFLNEKSLGENNPLDCSKRLLIVKIIASVLVKNVGGFVSPRAESGVEFLSFLD